MPDEPADADDPFLSSLIEQIAELEEGAEPAFPIPARRAAQPASAPAEPFREASSTLPDPRPLLDALAPPPPSPPAPVEVDLQAEPELQPDAPPEAQPEAQPAPERPGTIESLEEALALDDLDSFAPPPPEDVDDVLDLGAPMAPEDLGEPEPVASNPPPAPPSNVTLEALDESLADEVDDLLGDYASVEELESGDPAAQPPSAETPPAAAAVASSVETAPKPASESPAPEPARVRSSRLAPLLRYAGAVLHTLGAPVRGLPPSARLVVDFLALSLLLWVPLVWLIALFVVGR